MKKIFCYGRVGRFVRRVGAACHSLCSGVFATNSRRARGLGSVGFVAGRSSAGYPPGMQRCRGLAAVELIAAAGASAVGGAPGFVNWGNVRIRHFGGCGQVTGAMLGAGLHHGLRLPLPRLTQDASGGRVLRPASEPQLRPP
jgi:hypothetical protein